MPTETSLTSINLFKSQADYEANKQNLAEDDLVAIAIDLIPVGTIIAYSGDKTPSGFLDCSGASLNPTTYDNLFNVIGTTYGGDGSTTFNLPNLNNNSFLEGSDTVGIVKSAGLPNITGGNFGIISGETKTDGAFSLTANTSYGRGGGSVRDKSMLDMNASRCSSVYGNSNTVQPKSVTVKFCIKY